MRLAALALCTLLSTLAVSFASLKDIEVSAARKKLDENKSRVGSAVTVITKEIAYDITVKSRSFKPLENLTAKYMIFLEDAQANASMKTIDSMRKGSEQIPLIAANRSITFSTKPFKLSSDRLDAGWVYADGAKGVNRDRVRGIWVRVYNAEGTLLGEYANPSTVKKNDWAD